MKRNAEKETDWIVSDWNGACDDSCNDNASVGNDE